MTPTDFIIALKEYLEKLYANERFADGSGKLKAPAIYEQELPIVESYEGDLPDGYPNPPYILPKVMSWSGGFEGSTRQITVRVIFCIYDDDKQNKGQISILHLEEMLYQAIGKNPYIGSFEVSGNYSAAVTEEDNYPYFFGGVEFTAECAGVIRESEQA